MPNSQAPQIRLDVEAYNQGYSAGASGKFSGACPHQPLTLESLSWHSGFIEGRAALVGGNNDD